MAEHYRDYTKDRACSFYERVPFSFSEPDRVNKRPAIHECWRRRRNEALLCTKPVLRRRRDSHGAAGKIYCGIFLKFANSPIMHDADAGSDM